MTNPTQQSTLLSCSSPRGLAVVALALVWTLITVAMQSAQGQTFTVIHTFTGLGDGSQPEAGLTIDAAGNLYGTTEGGGTGYGTVFKLKRFSSGWILSPLYPFAGGNDGANPLSRVALAQDGTLYGTTYYGGESGCTGEGGCGTIFHLKPPAVLQRSAVSPWNEIVLYRFTGGIDGAHPFGDLIFDQAGDILGTTYTGGASDYGVVYELSPSGSAWTETVLYSPQDFGEGAGVAGGVVADSSGNLYGVFQSGGPEGYGAVYELSPSGGSWTEQILHAFSYDGNDGADPVGGLILDSSGNLYGITTGGNDGGAVFELTPANSGWISNTLHSGTGLNEDKLVMDGAGNLYGTTYYGGAYGDGTVFKLRPVSGGWAYTSLHDFTGGSDGYWPASTLVFDAHGHLYGTASQGGANNHGVIFEITP